MHNPFFSIVIPVYNGLTHDLPKCLDSIWQQPLDASLYEVICVDDCSTDGTRAWLHTQAAQHANMRVLENEVNIRQGGGRNRGFREARGKYIVLIDQDDYYHQGAISRVYNHLKESDLDVLIVDCAYERPGKPSNTLQHNFPHREVMTGDEIILKNSIPYAPWKFIFLRSLIIDNNLFFDENERIEDIDWVHRLVHRAKRVQYQPILFIHYLKGDTSTTMTSFKSPVTTYSSMRCGRRLYLLATNDFADSCDELKRAMVNLGENVFRLSLRNLLTCKDSVRNKRKAIKEIIAPHSKRTTALTKIAVAMPTVFSIVSNITATFLPWFIILRRKWKYRK